MQKSRRLKILVGLSTIPVAALLAWFLLTPENIDILKTVFSENMTNDEIQDHLGGLGIRGYVTIAILSMLQIVVAVLPAEPVQVVAGLIYGLWGGILACTVGVVLGNTLIFILYKIYGDKMRNYFDKKLSIDLDSAGNSKKIAFVIFLLYFLPAIPYGMICFLAATMGMKYPRYIAITVLGAIPSVFIGVSLGHIALASSWIISVAVFGVLVLVIAFIMLKKDYLIGKLNDYIKKMKEPYSSKTVVKKYSCAKLNIAHVIFNLIFAISRIRNKIINIIFSFCIFNFKLRIIKQCIMPNCLH